MATIDSKVHELLAQMTPAEKAGQLTQYFYFGCRRGRRPARSSGCARIASRMRRGGAGAGGEVGLAAVRHRSGRDQPAAAAGRRGQPARHPAALRLRRHPRLPHDLPGAARDGRLLGPGADRARPGGRGARGARRRASTGPSRRWSTSPAIRAGAGSSRARARTRTSASAMAAAQVRGFQGADLGAPDTIIAGPKHFAGYGAALGGRDYDEVNLSDSELRNVYLPPFKAAVEAGAGNIMTAYMDLNGVPATGNHWLLDEVLREDLGLRRLRRQRRERRPEPDDPRLRGRPDRRRAAGAQRRGRHGDGDGSTRPTSACRRRLQAGAVERGGRSTRASGACSRPSCAWASSSTPTSTRPGARGARRPGAPRRRARRRRAIGGAAAQRGRPAAARRGSAELDRRDRAAGRLQARHPRPLGLRPDLAETVTVLDGIRRKVGDGVRVDYAPGRAGHAARPSRRCSTCSPGNAPADPDGLRRASRASAGRRPGARTPTWRSWWWASGRT